MRETRRHVPELIPYGNAGNIGKSVFDLSWQFLHKNFYTNTLKTSNLFLSLNDKQIYKHAAV